MMRQKKEWRRPGSSLVWRQLASLFLLMGWLLGNWPGPPPVLATQIFPDVPDTHPQAVYINDLAQAGIVVKTGRFRPEDNISRAELLKMVMGGAGHALVTLTAAPTFVDVRQDNSFFPWIETAVRQSFVHGYRDRFGRFTWLFKPWDQVTRGEAIKMVVATFELSFPLGAGEPNYSDVTNQDAFWPFIRIAGAQGLLLANVGQALKPAEKIKRAEVAKLASIARALRSGSSLPGGGGGSGSDGNGGSGSGNGGGSTMPIIQDNVEAQLTPGVNADRTIRAGDNNVLLLSLDLIPRTTKAVVLRQLEFKRSGIGDRSDFLALNLFVNGQRVAGPYTLTAENKVVFLLNVLPPDIAASGTTVVELRGTLQAAANVAEHIFSIESPIGLVVSPKDSNDHTLIGVLASLPLTGGRLRVTSAGQITTLSVLFTPAKSGTDTYRLGDTRVDLGTLTLAATGEDVILSQLIFTAKGSYLEIANLELGDIASNNLPVGNRVPQVANLKATFDFSQEPSGGLQINDQQTRSLLLRGDLLPSDASRVGSTVPASEVRLVIENSADLTARTRVSNLGVQVQLSP